MDLAAFIRQKAVEMGFDAVGIAPAARSRHAAAYRSWLDAGRHADMDWMAREPERRMDPGLALPGAKSVVAAGFSCFAQDPLPEVWNDPSRGRIARYAWGQDYHDVLKPRLEGLAAFIRAEGGLGVKTRTFLDSGPVMDRSLAEQAGLGFIGRNTMLISPKLGSYLFLGEILVTIDLPDSAIANPKSEIQDGSCGECRQCLNACPTKALVSDFTVDARRCISYHTVENKRAIPEDIRPLMGNWVFGCDECQQVCPWVKRCSKPKRDSFLVFDPDFAAPRLLDLIELDEAAFRIRYLGSPVMRAKRGAFLRNVCVALGNWGSREALPALEKARRDADPLVAEHAAWAIERIATSSG